MTEEELNAIRAVMRQEIGTAMATNEQRMDERFAGVSQQIVNLDKRVTGLDERVAGLDKRVTNLSEQVTNLDEQIEGIDDQIGHTDERIQNLARHMDTTMQPMAARLARLENMVEPMASHLVLFRASLRDLQSNYTRIESGFTRTRSDLGEVLAILNGAIIRINELQNDLFDSVATINRRIDLHENMPVDQTHPLPNLPRSNT